VILGADTPRTDTSHQNLKNGGGMWPQCGVTPTPHTIPRHWGHSSRFDSCLARLYGHRGHSDFRPASPRGRPDHRADRSRPGARGGYFVVVTFGLRLLTAHPPQDYITPLRRASVFGRDVAPAKHLTDIRWPSFRSLSEAWSFDGSPARRRGNRHGFRAVWQVNRKKEKRGRRSPCGLLCCEVRRSTLRKAFIEKHFNGKWPEETSAVLRF